MLDTTTLKNELQARINALTNASTFDQVLDVAIAVKKATAAGLVLTRTNVDTQLQRLTNAVGAGSAIEDLIEIAASVSVDGSHPPIGHVKSCPFAGDKFTDLSGHEWLLKGMLHTKAGYEKALENKALCSYGRLVYPGGVSGMVTQAATDGLGNIVIACSNDTYVLVSHDNGETVTAVPHNHAGKVTSVIFIGGAFVLASNTATAINTSYSIDGGTTFSDDSVARALTAGTVDSVRGASDGSIGMFVVGGDAACVSFTSGTAKTSRTLPAAMPTSYIPVIVIGGGVIIVGRKNANQYYRSVNGGANFATLTPPLSTISQELCFALGKFFWCGQSGSTFYLVSSVDGSTWENKWASLPEPFRSSFATLGSNYIRLFSVTGGMVVGLRKTFYFTNDFVNFKLINFSRSATELGGSYAEHFCFHNIVLGGFSLNESQGGSNTGILKVDYSTPDYVGIHIDGVPAINEGMYDYVRIR